MMREHICVIGLLALLFIPANASARNATITLIPTEKPIHRTYPGVDASILGIRTGMTDSEAEAVAKLVYQKQAFGLPSSSVSFWHNGDTIKSKIFANSMEFNKYNAISSDNLELIFTTPVTGHVVDAMIRKNTFSGGKFPLIRDIEASLIRKYGPPSYLGPQTDRRKSVYGAVIIAWIFSEYSHVICKSYDCVGGIISNVPTYFDLSFPDKKRFDASVRKACGASASSPAVFKILAQIDLSNVDTAYHKTLASDVTVTMWDAQACVNDREQARSQFEAAAAKLFPSAAVGAAAISPHAAESASPAARPISFYGDIGNAAGGHNPLVTRPSTLLLTEDGSVALVRLRWVSWGTSIARAVGFWSASSCTPSCATGQRMTSVVKLNLSNPGLVDGHWVYRCFEIVPPHPQRDIEDHACLRAQGTDYDYAAVSNR